MSFEYFSYFKIMNYGKLYECFVLYIHMLPFQVTESWMKEYGYWLDIMAVSCDSFDEKVNKKIGR